MTYHIFVDNSDTEEKRGKASSIDELFKLLTNKEKQKIFAKGAFASIQKLFHDEEVKYSENSYMGDVCGIPIHFVSDGYEITTLVFYF